MANLTVQVINMPSGEPVRNMKVALRPLPYDIDFDSFTDKNGMATFLMVEPGPAEFYVAGALKAKIEIEESAKNPILNGQPVKVELWFKPRCFDCNNWIERYEGSFASTTYQYKGTICEKCHIVRCDNCWPTSKGTTCHCGGKLQPAFYHLITTALSGKNLVPNK